jgi:glutathione synthase/RimK-type ligase-like ATP-grasp enzyme
MNQHRKRKEKLENGTITETRAEKEPVVLFICKPESGSQGRGIFIATKVEDLRVTLNKN